MLAELRSKEAPTTAPEPSSLPDPKDKIEEQNLLHAAMLASEDNRPADARKTLEKVLTLDSKSPTALRQLGELELQAGDYVQAAHHLKAAIEARPDDAAALFHEGQALEKTHDLGGARDALEASLKLMPGQFEARLLLGQVYLGLKDPAAAEDQFEAALLLQSGSVQAQLGLADAQITKGNFAEAAQSLEALSRVQAKNAHVFDLLAKAYSGLGKRTEAQQAATRAKLLSSNK
jgi:predicted Zn-dependent protease